MEVVRTDDDLERLVKNGLLKYLQINFGNVCTLINILNAMVNVFIDGDAEHVLFHIWIYMFGLHLKIC